MFLPIIMALVLMGVSIYLFGTETPEGIATLIVLGVYMLISVITFFRISPEISRTLMDYSMEHGKVQKELLRELDVPYAILDQDAQILWANDMFHDVIEVNRSKRLRKSIEYYFPEITNDVLQNAFENIVEVEHGDKMYRIETKDIDLGSVFEDDGIEHDEGDVVIAMYLFDVTDLRKYEKYAIDQKLYAGLVYIDNYDEVMDSLEDVKHSILSALVDRKINMYLNNIDAIVKHIENDKYFFVFRQKYMDTLKKDRFSLLEEVKNINVGNDINMTLSIGIGSESSMDTNSFTNSYENARTAIGLALGRGGDQVAIKIDDKVTYYGGKSAGTEKTTRVKARVKAQAFEELLQSKDNVIIMAHKRPDADAFGSAMGIYRLATTLGKKSYVVLNEVTDAIRPLYNTFANGINYEGVFLKSSEAIAQVNSDTMVVVCDVNKPSMTECEQLLSMVSTVVIFDHHRQTSESISETTLSYIEPFASSACEMIAEMYQYVSRNPKLRTQEADAMYAGILIDTDNFLNKTGVRTFEAASYLRKNGADVTRVRKMFRSSIDVMKEQAQGISNAEVFMDVFALSFVESDEKMKEAPTVAVAKVANELLNVVDIKASFVVTEGLDGVLYVSGRSTGEINVQVILEKWGGGGHQTVAGAQLEGRKKDDFFRELKGVLRQMYSEGDL
jgi:c-di-AMP phosphodiesterase-like protein